MIALRHTFIPGEVSVRTTISLPDDLGRLVRTEARRRGVSLSTVIRRSLEMSLRKPPGARLPWQGIVNDRGGQARNVDAVLAAGWADRIAGDR